MDPHEVLGVSPDASEAELRAAYRDLVRRHHPDRHVGESEAYRANQARRMAEVTGAWTLLHDPDALARYRANQARVGRPPTATTSPTTPRSTASRSTGPRATGPRDGSPTAGAADDDQLHGRWARTPTPPAERVAAASASAGGRASRPRTRGTGPSRTTRVLNAIGWVVLVGLLAAVLLLGTDRGRDILDDVLAGPQATTAGAVDTVPRHGTTIDPSSRTVARTG